MRLNRIYLLLLTSLLISSCAVLPETLNETSLIVVTHCKWIGKFGEKTISESAAKPILRNLKTGVLYKPDYNKKSYTYFYKLPKGTYAVEEIVLDAGQVCLHIGTAEKTKEFEINSNSGIFFIGGLDIIDYQFRLEYKVHEEEENQRDLATINNLLTEKTSLSNPIKINTIENIFIKEKWENENNKK